MIEKVLIIQTASLGDVILATSLAESIHHQLPGAKIHFLIKKGYEALFTGHPYIDKLFVWNKKEKKNRYLLKLMRDVRRERYDAVLNVHRFASSGLIAAASGAPIRSGFSKNPLSFRYTHRFPHIIDPELKNSPHEIQRNFQLLKPLGISVLKKPALYPSAGDEAVVKPFAIREFITISPASLWNTKQFPEEKWLRFIGLLGSDINIHLLGSAADKELCSRLIEKSGMKNILNLAGSFNFLQSAALMKKARMNYTNDSAPLHLASAVNAPVSVIFCSTVPAFGFGPLSTKSHIIETDEVLNCRPCGLHGHAECPERHFACALKIDEKKLLSTLKNGN